MNANTLASAVAAARNAGLPPALRAQPLPIAPQAIAPAAPRAAAPSAPQAIAPAAPQTVAPAAPQAVAPVARPMPVPPALSDADALMIAIQRSAGTVDDLMTRRMLLASGRARTGSR